MGAFVALVKTSLIVSIPDVAASTIPATSALVQLIFPGTLEVKE